MCAKGRVSSSGGKCGCSGAKGTGSSSGPGSRRANPSSSGTPRCCSRRSSGAKRRTTDMLQAIVQWSVRQRFVVVILAVALLGAGFYATQHAALDVFPEFTPPQVTVQTEAPGLSPTEVEQLVTTPVEAAVSGLPRLEVSRS